MIDLKTVRQIKNAPVEERIQIIEFILQSLKNDIRSKFENENANYKKFKIRKFSLGEEVHVDRDELYSKRGL
jgi:hypothetical protein